MAFSAEEQELYDWLKSSLPSWLFQDDDAAEEVWGAIVKGVQPVRAQVDSWRDALEILLAEGVWLNQHARDRGTFRQASETDVALRSRLRTVEDAVTLPALEAAINAVLDATGVTADCAIVELRKDRAFFNTYTPIGSGVADDFTLVPGTTTVQLNGVVPSPSGYEVYRGSTITIAGATSAANNGTFPIVGIANDRIEYTNAAGVEEGFAGTWQVDSNADGRKVAYMSRGYRMTRQFTADAASVSSARAAQSFIVILPYGTTAATALAVTEALRKKRAGGILVYVERRVNP
jgi:hypothetical protein